MSLCEEINLCSLCTILTGCFFAVSNMENEFGSQGKCLNLTREFSYDSKDYSMNIFHPMVCDITQDTNFDEFKDAIEQMEEKKEIEKVEKVQLKNYLANVDPGSATITLTVVGLQLDLIQFEIDETSEPVFRGDASLHLGWNDSRLVWKSSNEQGEKNRANVTWDDNDNNDPGLKEDHQNEDVLWFTENEVWFPEVFPSKEKRKALEIDRLVQKNTIGVYQDGWVTLKHLVRITSSCQPDFERWPFHSYLCTFSMNLDPQRMKNVHSWIPLNDNYNENSNDTSSDYVSTKFLARNPNWTVKEFKATRRSPKDCKLTWCRPPFIMFLLAVQKYHPFTAVFYIALIFIIVGATIRLLLLQRQPCHLNEKRKIVMVGLDFIFIGVLLIALKSLIPSATGGTPILYVMTLTLTWTLALTAVRLLTWTLVVLVIPFVISILCYFSHILQFPQILNPVITNKSLLKLLRLYQNQLTLTSKAASELPKTNPVNPNPSLTISTDNCSPLDSVIVDDDADANVVSTVNDHEIRGQGQAHGQEHDGTDNNNDLVSSTTTIPEENVVQMPVVRDGRVCNLKGFTFVQLKEDWSVRREPGLEMEPVPVVTATASRVNDDGINRNCNVVFEDDPLLDLNSRWFRLASVVERTTCILYSGVSFVFIVAFLVSLL